MPSGENQVVDAQASALREAGHDVVVVSQSTDQRQQRRTYPLEAAVTVATGLGPSPEEELRRFRPDVVHVHNLFPSFGRRWLRSWDGPVVATMHNYRPICPAATLFRDGGTCRDCPESGSTRPAVRHGCYRGSRLATLPVATGTRFARDPVLVRADVVTTLSDGMSREYVAAGVPAEKLTVLDNFTTAASSPGPGGDTWIYAGRTDPSKGLHALVRDWPAGQRLLVAGALDPDRPLPEHPDVDCLGRVDGDRLRDLMGEARGLVFPSVWLEGLALVCLEALSVGTPILTFDDVPAGRSVTELGVGLAVARDDVAGGVRRATDAFPGLRERCTHVFAEQFTARSWVRRAEAVYAHAMSARGG
ncbi:glycosyltransferase family 4 protein [Nocardioides sp. HDW12B]|uniref:glycosyltransferase family 4 protein n=1 Tax=Nocardioides sp. HDW12B TaxID=2714939 RepID=UPI00140861CD|nr:glycosyltransferase family 4 protein [Nocardioides sp. HDW12B]QIK65370.1 glycosyltransferase family 4 protein [Nocardioides sp. HDW12B]